MGEKITKMTSPLWKFALRQFSAAVTYILFGFLLYLILLAYLPDYDVLFVLAYVLVVTLSLGFLYSGAWRFGQRDRNLVMYGHMPDNRLRGLWAGLLACAPFAIAYAAVALTLGPRVQNLYFTPLLLVPVVSAIGYIMGMKIIRLSDKIIYRTPQKNDKRLR